MPIIIMYLSQKEVAPYYTHQPVGIWDIAGANSTNILHEVEAPVETVDSLSHQPTII
jgi:hypothetical protein